MALTGIQKLKYSDINDSRISGVVTVQCDGDKGINSLNGCELKIANRDGYLSAITGLSKGVNVADLQAYYSHFFNAFTNLYAITGRHFPITLQQMMTTVDGKPNPICPTVFWLVEDTNTAGSYNITKDSLWNIYRYFCGNVGEVFMDLAIVFGQLAVESLDQLVGASGNLNIKWLYSARGAFKKSTKSETIMGLGQNSLETTAAALSTIRSMATTKGLGSYNKGIARMYYYAFKAIKTTYGYGGDEILNEWNAASKLAAKNKKSVYNYTAKCAKLHLALMEADAGYNALCHLGCLLAKFNDTLTSNASASALTNAGLGGVKWTLGDIAKFCSGEIGLISKDLIIETLMRYHGESLKYTNTGLDILLPLTPNNKGIYMNNFGREIVGLQFADMIAKSAAMLYGASISNAATGGLSSGTMLPSCVANDFEKMVYLFGRRIATDKDVDVYTFDNIGKYHTGTFCGARIRWSVKPNEYDFGPYVYRALLGKTKAEGSKEEKGDKTDPGLPAKIGEWKATATEEKTAILNSLATSIANTKVLQYKEWLKENDNIFAQSTALDFMSSLSSVNLAGIIGLPIRYSRLSDLNTKDYYDIINPDDNYSRKANIYGRNYAENTVLYGNMVSLTPCRPKFMGNNDGKTVAQLLSSMSPTGKEGTLTAEEQGKLNQAVQQSTANASAGGPTLFTAVPAGSDYSRTVAFALRSAAMLFGVSEDDFKKMFDENELKSIGGAFKNPFDYYSSERAFSNIFSDIYTVQTNKTSADNNTKGVAALLSNMYSIVVYNSGMLESSESISNNVGPSFIDQLVNLPMSEIARDANFLMNSGGVYSEKKDDMIGTLNQLSDSRNNTDATQAVKDGVGGVLGIVKSSSSKMFGSIKLPKIWKGSEYTKTYNVKIKLTSPSPDYLSVFKYIMAELIRLMPLWSPQQWGYYQDTISAPYLVQVYNRGTMSIENGMVTGVEVNRSPETMGLNGLPTELDINLTITDLFPYFSMPSKEDDYSMARHHASGFLPYISTFAGVPLYRGDTSEFMQSKVQFFKSKVVSIGNAPGKMVNDNIAGWLHKASNVFR